MAGAAECVSLEEEERPRAPARLTVTLQHTTDAPGAPECFLRLAAAAERGTAPALALEWLDDLVVVRVGESGQRLGTLPRRVADRIRADLDEDVSWAPLSYRIDPRPHAVSEVDENGVVFTATEYRPSIAVELARIEWLEDDFAPRIERMGFERARRPATPTARGRQMMDNFRRAQAGGLGVVDCGDDVYAVASQSGDGFYQVVVNRQDAAEPLFCNCRAGTFYGALQFPCVHAATVALRTGLVPPHTGATPAPATHRRARRRPRSDVAAPQLDTVTP